jgi:hypothetical protein
VSATPARTLSAVRDPSTYPHWVPGVVEILDNEPGGDFTCVFRFAVFSLKFKVSRTAAEDGVTRFSTSAVIIGKVDATVSVAPAEQGGSSVSVGIDGILRSSAMHRMAQSLFEKGADVVSQRLSAYLGEGRPV